MEGNLVDRSSNFLSSCPWYVHFVDLNLIFGEFKMESGNTRKVACNAHSTLPKYVCMEIPFKFYNKKGLIRRTTFGIIPCTINMLNPDIIENLPKMN